MGLNKDMFSFDNVNTRDPSVSIFQQSYQIRERAWKYETSERVKYRRVVREEAKK